MLPSMQHPQGQLNNKVGYLCIIQCSILSSIYNWIFKNTG